MEQTTLKMQKEQATEVAAPIAVMETEEVLDNFPVAKRSPNFVGKPTNGKRADVDSQKQQMRLIAGDILLHFKKKVHNNELTLDEEIKVFNSISKYLGYPSEGNKTVEDIGMDTFAMKYLEIDTRVKNVAKNTAAKLVGKL